MVMTIIRISIMTKVMMIIRMVLLMMSIIMMMPRMSVAMMVVTAAAAGPPGAPKTGRTAAIPQKLILATHFMTLNRYLGESTIFPGGDGGVPASQHRAALMPTAVMLSITTSIIMVMTRMTVAMVIVEAAGAGPPVHQRRAERRLYHKFFFLHLS